MKYSSKILLGVLGFIALLGIYIIFQFKVQFSEYEENAIKGNKDYKKESRTHSGFQEIDVNGDYEVILKQGDFKVEVEAESNLLEHLKTDVKGETLRLYTEKGFAFRATESPKIYIAMPEIRRIAVFGHSDLATAGVFTGDHVEAQIMGSGDMDLNFKCNTLKTSINGHGDINVEGEGNFFESSISGSGEIDADEFIAENANVRISGSGDVSVNASGHLEIGISGSGDVRYVGTPESVNKNISGSGDIRQL